MVWFELLDVQTDAGADVMADFFSLCSGGCKTWVHGLPVSKASDPIKYKAYQASSMPCKIESVDFEKYISDTISHKLSTVTAEVIASRKFPDTDVRLTITHLAQYTPQQSLKRALVCVLYVNAILKTYSTLGAKCKMSSSAQDLKDKLLTTEKLNQLAATTFQQIAKSNVTVPSQTVHALFANANFDDDLLRMCCGATLVKEVTSANTSFVDLLSLRASKLNVPSMSPDMFTQLAEKVKSILYSQVNLAIHVQ